MATRTLDPRDLPIYGIAEAARYLHVPASTLRAWTVGQSNFDPVIQVPDGKANQLSFTNLCEAHVCSALRRGHGVTMQRIRRALEVLRDLYPRSRHPLVEHELATSERMDIFVTEFGRVTNLTQGGQTEVRHFLTLYLRRVEYGRDGVRRLFPFTWTNPSPDTPKVVMLDPTVHVGRPTIVDTRVPAAAVRERWEAGESLRMLAEDYGLPEASLEEALRCAA